MLSPSQSAIRDDHVALNPSSDDDLSMDDQSQPGDPGSESSASVPDSSPERPKRRVKHKKWSQTRSPTP